MSLLRAVIVGAGRMAGTIDDEMADYPDFVLPYSHAAGYAQVPEVELVAIADLDLDKARSLQARYSIPRVYADYREMIQAEAPDLVSITTPGVLHAEVTIFAAEHGAKGIYCEKAFACSLAEADAMVEAVERNGVKFNMGTLRRWNSGANKVREMIAAGEMGACRSVISFSVGSLLHSASHFIDFLCYFAQDAPVEWVEGTVLTEGFDPAAPRVDTDLDAVGTVRFQNGVWGHLLSAPLWAQFEVICDRASFRTANDCGDWDLWTAYTHGTTARYRRTPFPDYPRESSTVRLISDLVQAVRTGGETQQGVRAAGMSAEIAFGLIESHRRGGARVALPIQHRDFWMFTH